MDKLAVTLCKNLSQITQTQQLSEHSLLLDYVLPVCESVSDQKTVRE